MKKKLQPCAGCDKLYKVGLHDFCPKCLKLMAKAQQKRLNSSI